MAALTSIPTLVLVPELDGTMVLWEPVGVVIREAGFVDEAPALGDVVVVFCMAAADEFAMKGGCWLVEDKGVA